MEPSSSSSPRSPIRNWSLQRWFRPSGWCSTGSVRDRRRSSIGYNVAAVAQICRRLDGIPLALELAAARFRLLSPAEVAARLDDRFRLLTAGSRTVLDRHRTLQATVDWGYELLSQPERTVLGRLSVFAGGFDLKAAEAVVPDGEEIVSEEVLGLLGLLVDRSWVGMEAGSPRTRYRLLETVRQYAAEKLVAAGDSDEVRRRHTRHFVEFGTFLPDHPLRPPSWMRAVDTDQDNLRAALEQSFAGGDIEGSLRLTAGLSRFWGLTGRIVEGRTWLQRALEAAPPEGSVGLVGALNGMGFLLFQAGAPPVEASAFYERARVMAQSIGDRSGAAVACGLLGFRALQRGELEEAERLVGEVMEGFAGTGTVAGPAWGESCLGWIASARGDLPGAAAHFERMLFLAVGDKDSEDLVAHALAALGPLTAALGDGVKAMSFAQEAIEVARGLGVRQVLVMALTRAVETVFRLGDAALAARFLEESLRLLRDMEGLSWVAYSLELSALIVAADDRHHLAAHLLGAAHALDEVSQESAKARPLNDEVENCMGRLVRALGHERLTAELDAGAGLPVKEALGLALDELASR